MSALLIWGAVTVLVILVLFVISVYNNLIVLRNRIQNSSAQINVQLKKRADLVPNLVETVKGYAKHERGVFENVTKARSAVMNAKGVEGRLSANNQLTAALKTLFAVAENYPKLRANENFLELQRKLSDIEDKIAYTRQFYNDTVLIYNNKVQMFPSNVIAGMFGFGTRKMFQIGEAERKAPKVEF